jgi:Cytochrome c
MKREWLAAVVLSGAVFISACSSDSGSDTGTGGKAGSAGKGGSTGSGGGIGTGGKVGSGGNASTGGTSGTGGVVGTGGTATGGASTGGQGGGAAGSGAGGGASTGGKGGSAGVGTAGKGGGIAGSGGSAGAGGLGGSVATGGAGGAAGAKASGGNAGGSAGAAGAAGGAAGSGTAGAGGGVVVDPVVARGEYLVRNVLGCAGCHTPQGGAFLSGTDCFVKNGTSCLSAPNLTNDNTGLKMLTDAQIKDAFTKGIDPDEPTKFLFSTMPYYQFKNLSDADANAIVAFLRTVPAVARTPMANTAPYDAQPTAAEWQPVAPTDLPAAGTASGPTNGKYLATLTCVTCHTVEVNASATPHRIDATKAFQGGKVVTATVSGTMKMIQSSNLTPDATGLMSWNTTQVAAAITTAKDKNGVALCGMRALANMTSSDAADIGTYLLSIPPVANARTMTCQ